MNIRKAVLPAAVTLAALMVMASPAVAGDTACTGALTGVHDNVIVPAGAACTLIEAEVKGNVKALQDSALKIEDSRIAGNVEGDKADVVQAFRAVVGGNVTITEGGPAGDRNLPSPFQRCGPPVTLCEVLLFDVTIEGGNTQIQKMTGDVFVGHTFFGGTRVGNGNLKVEENFVPAGNHFEIRNNIADNLQVFKNTGPGPKRVDLNTVGANLQCFENEAPFTGGPNTAAKAEGQCF